MASLELILEIEEYRKLLLHIAEISSRVWYIPANSTEVRILTLRNIDDMVAMESTTAVVKHIDFAKDEPNVATFAQEGLRWSMFVELKGDGHIKIKSRKFSAFDTFWVYMVIGYTTFFVRDSGERIPPHGKLIAMYRDITNFTKKIAARTKLGEKTVYISKNIQNINADVIGEIEKKSGII